MNKVKAAACTLTTALSISVSAQGDAAAAGTSWIESFPQQEDGSFLIEAGSHFSALNEASLSIEASSSNPAVMTAGASGTTIQLQPKGTGSAMITAEGRDGNFVLSDRFQTDVTKLGDITGDGVLTSDDVLFVYKVINKKVTITEAQKKAIDMNGDGVITAADASLIMKTYTGGSSSQPVSEKFIVEWSNVNDAPAVVKELPVQTAGLNEAWQWQLPDRTFIDIDEGDELTYSASMEDGQPLPAWLSFDPSSRTFTGTPTAEETLSIKITAKDQEQETAEVIVEVTVKPSNRAPVVLGQASEQLVIKNVQEKSVDLSSLVSDPNGDALTYTVSSLDASIATGAMSGSTLQIQSAGRGTTKLKVTASDGKESVDTYVNVHAVEMAPGGFIDVNTKLGVPNVNIDLAPYFSNATSLALMPSANAASLAGKIFSYMPVASGTGQFWVLSADHYAVRMTINTAAQSGSRYFFSEYLDAGNGRIALEVYNSAPEQPQGYVLEMHQYDTKTKQRTITTYPMLYQPYRGGVYIAINEIFYDFMDVTSATYYNDSFFMWIDTKYPVAFVLKKDGQIMDVIGSLAEIKPIIANGGTIVRKPGILTGSSSYQLFGEWDQYPSGSFQFMGRHNP